MGVRGGEGINIPPTRKFLFLSSKTLEELSGVKGLSLSLSTMKDQESQAKSGWKGSKFAYDMFEGKKSTKTQFAYKAEN